jgi:hypothetical protein
MAAASSLIWSSVKPMLQTYLILQAGTVRRSTDSSASLQKLRILHRQDRPLQRNGGQGHVAIRPVHCPAMPYVCRDRSVFHEGEHPGLRAAHHQCLHIPSARRCVWLSDTRSGLCGTSSPAPPLLLIFVQPLDFRNGVVVACCTSNWGNLPLRLCPLPPTSPLTPGSRHPKRPVSRPVQCGHGSRPGHLLPLCLYPSVQHCL